MNVLALANIKPLDLVNKTLRARELYNKELKKGVELGRRLGAFEKRYGKLHAYITEVVTLAIVEGGSSPNDPLIIVLRNAIRIMKGKNKL